MPLRFIDVLIDQSGPKVLALQLFDRCQVKHAQRSQMCLSETEMSLDLYTKRSRVNTVNLCLVGLNATALVTSTPQDHYLENGSVDDWLVRVPLLCARVFAGFCIRHGRTARRKAFRINMGGNLEKEQVRPTQNLTRKGELRTHTKEESRFTFTVDMIGRPIRRVALHQKCKS